MTTEVVLWVLGIVVSIVVAIITAGVKFVFTISERLTRVETVIATFSSKTAKIMHLDDDAHGADTYLDLLQREYETKQQIMNKNEWIDFKTRCEAVENDDNKPKGERMIAAWLASVASNRIIFSSKSRFQSSYI